MFRQVKFLVSILPGTCVMPHLILHQQKIIELGDKTDDDHLTLDEFLRYCMDHEKKLWLVFKSIDTNNSGILSLLYMLCYAQNNLILSVLHDIVFDINI